MKGQVIGKTMPHGYAGSYSRQADMIVDTHPCEAGIAFGAPVVLGTTGAVKAWEAASTAAKFVGVAVCFKTTNCSIRIGFILNSSYINLSARNRCTILADYINAATLRTGTASPVR